MTYLSYNDMKIGKKYASRWWQNSPYDYLQPIIFGKCMYAILSLKDKYRYNIITIISSNNEQDWYEI
jgi:hypothetical protein